MMRTKMITFVIIVITMISCNNEKKSTNETLKESIETTVEEVNTVSKTQNIENIQWTLTTLDGEAVHKLKENDQNIHFMLNPDGNRVSGFSGCNTFIGIYSIENGNHINFSKMVSTKVACPVAAIDEAELLNVFEMADNFIINKGKLKLNTKKIKSLAEFQNLELLNEDIVEKYWKLKSLNGKDIKMLDNQEREIYFTLKSQDNNLVGFAGCNVMSGKYFLEDDNRIRFNNIATTLKSCPDVSITETNFLKIFELVDHYTIHEDVLSLNVGKKTPLAIFEAIYMP
jgi:heat shock protein HslJ